MKFCVIGLGRLGYQVATGLAENGMEVMAVDSNETIVASIRDNVTQAICMRVTDEASLRSIGVDAIDTVIVATGENFAQSILITALLKKRLKVKTVIARAINDIHQEILNLVGADRIILPEREIGIKLADNLSSPFTELVRLSRDFSIMQLEIPLVFIGKKISHLDLLKKYNLTCIGLKDGASIKLIDPNYIIAEKDILLFAGNNKDLEKVSRL